MNDGRYEKHIDPKQDERQSESRWDSAQLFRLMRPGGKPAHESRTDLVKRVKQEEENDDGLV